MIPLGTPRLPHSAPGRLVMGAFLLSCTILVSVYTANLMAFLAVRRLQMPFSTLEEFVDNSHYKFGVLGGAVHEDMLLNTVSK